MKLPKLIQSIHEYEKKYHRSTNSVQLLAVSKAQSIEAIKKAYQAGQKNFGENYLQEALTKINALKDCEIEWHFIGAIQSNKTTLIAENFAWVHGVDDLKHAQRLGKARLAFTDQVLNICIQVNISQEQTKSGVSRHDLNQLAQEIKEIPGLRLRGLMTILQANLDFEQQRAGFRQLALTQQQLNAQGFHLDTLSMGMSQDYEAAIAEGATLVRIGSAIFGEREK